MFGFRWTINYKLKEERGFTVTLLLTKHYSLK
jgi:hypothetical protein